MNSKALTGLLLIIGPILMTITFFLPGAGGNEDWVTADYVAEIAGNIQLHTFVTLLELAGIISMMIGWVFLAYSMYETILSNEASSITAFIKLVKSSTSPNFIE